MATHRTHDKGHNFDLYQGCYCMNACCWKWLATTGASGRQLGLNICPDDLLSKRYLLSGKS